MLDLFELIRESLVNQHVLAAEIYNANPLPECEGWDDLGELSIDDDNAANERERCLLSAAKILGTGGYVNVSYTGNDSGRRDLQNMHTVSGN